MIEPSIVRGLRRANRPTAIILGLNEIASAIAVRVHRMGYGVVKSHDPNPPVIRRGMAFHDALYDDLTALGGLTAVSIDNAVKARAQVLAHECIAVTRNALSDLMVLGEIGVLIDARMQKRVVRPDLRHLARVAIGLGPGFTVGWNCDVAIETRPGHEGVVFERRATAAPDGVCRDLGGRGRERFVYAEEAGRWHTALDVGTRIFKGFPLGRLGDARDRSADGRAPARHCARRHRCARWREADRDRCARAPRAMGRHGRAGQAARRGDVPRVDGARTRREPAARARRASGAFASSGQLMHAVGGVAGGALGGDVARDASAGRKSPVTPAFCTSMAKRLALRCISQPIARMPSGMNAPSSCARWALSEERPSCHSAM